MSESFVAGVGRKRCAVLWFKKKLPVETFMQGLVKEKLPKAVQFFDKENDRAHQPLNVNDTTLLEVGVGMALFYMGKFFPDSDKANLAIMSRAYKAAEKLLPTMNAKPKEAHKWWKAYTDGLIFNEKEPRLKIACRLTWEKLISNQAYRESSPLKMFAYVIETEVETISKLNLK